MEENYKKSKKENQKVYIDCLKESYLMSKFFNDSADCKPDLHYMIDISKRLEQIKVMVDAGKYFTINRARQYGKTTTLQMLSEYLKNEYIVVSLDFQMISYEDFNNEQNFTGAFARELLEVADKNKNMSKTTAARFKKFANGHVVNATLSMLFKCLIGWCGESPQKIVLIIDEVDSATNNQVFLDFLAQLRGYYIKRNKIPTFQSVILAGVYDVKNLKRKIGAGGVHKANSPWNIAADFLVDMSFSAKDIAGMLIEYEVVHSTGMNMEEMAALLYDYTSGYPFLVSRLCKLIDERVAGNKDFPNKGAAWTKEGFLEAVKFLLAEPNTLFESLINKLEDYPELEEMIRDLLFRGKEIAYVIGIRSIDMALMFGFVKKSDNNIVIANRIFEILLYNYSLASPAMRQDEIYNAALKDRNQFIQNGHLNMRLVLEKFVTHFDDLYGNRGESFLEEEGRRYFLLYLRPIINGSGNYYIESQTRSMERTDVIVDYNREQFVIELKIWRGNEYHKRGEKQLLDYLDYYHLNKGYMLSFNFNQKKDIGVKEIEIGDKVLVEAVV